MMKFSILVLSITIFLMNIKVSMSQDRMLNIPQKNQETKAWCWAASVSAVLEYYGISISQCEIVDYKRIVENRDLKFANCCLEEDKIFDKDSPCDDETWGAQSIQGSEASIEGCLVFFGSMRCEHINGVISFEDIKEEIDHGRPIIVGWWEANNGHTVVVTGYKEPNTVNVMDPWNGDNNYGGLMSYDALVQNIRYTWIATLKISCIDEITIGGNISADTGTEFIYEAGSNIQLRSINYRKNRNSKSNSYRCFYKKVAYGVYTSYVTVTSSCGKTRTLNGYPVIIYE